MKARFVFLGEETPEHIKRKESLVRESVKTLDGLCKIQEFIKSKIKNEAYHLFLDLKLHKFEELYIEIENINYKDRRECEMLGERLIELCYPEYHSSLIQIYSFGRLENDK